MGVSKIITIGFNVSDDAFGSADLSSGISLLDWDVVLFRPDISAYTTSYGTFQGKPSLGEDESFKLKSYSDHWQRELKGAFEAGKTVIVFLSKKQEVYVRTGEREFSGTGKNRQPTHIVDVYCNYDSIPVAFKATSSTGSSMKLAPATSEPLVVFWEEFKKEFEYHAILDDVQGACLLTKTADKPVSAMYVDTLSSGIMLLFPDIDFYGHGFVDEAADEWSKSGEQFGRRFLSAVVALDKGLRVVDDVTPEPTWAAATNYRFVKEDKLRRQLALAEKELAAAKSRVAQISGELQGAGKLRGLLYEKGKALEVLVVDALRIMGFRAEPFSNATSEFDVVFDSVEGRLIGEAEGKDSKAINVEKLRQLSMNIQEDLQRDEVECAAKPVLFGNAFRLSALEARPDQFTKKCIGASLSSSTALVATCDLFWVARYLHEHPDELYAQACRNTLMTSVGLVKFPAVPVAADLVVPPTTDP